VLRALEPLVEVSNERDVARRGTASELCPEATTDNETSTLKVFKLSCPGCRTPLEAKSEVAMVNVLAKHQEMNQCMGDGG